MEQETARLIAAIGILCQLMVDVLLVTVFVLLRKYAAGRKWFYAWTWAWGFLAVSLACVSVSYFVPMPSAAAVALQFIYLVGKIAFLAYLVAGYVLYVGGPRRLVRLRFLFGLSLLYAAIAYLFSRGVTPTVIWQGIPNVLLFLYAAGITARIPVRRRMLGTKLSSVTFGVMAALWIIYTVGFAPQLRPVLGELSGTLLFIARNNAYFDIATHIMLAFGMVLILLEDAKREVLAAHLKLGRAHRRLRDQSMRDPLTSCFNRRAFTEGTGLERIEGGGAVVVADLDNLKEINDQHGHSAGDLLLQHFAATLRTALRGSDRLYRWGGDEFLLILPEGEADSVLPRLEKHLKYAYPCEREDGQPLPMEASIGAADFLDGNDLEHAIHEADRAMYEQKRLRKQQGAETL